MVGNRWVDGDKLIEVVEGSPSSSARTITGIIRRWLKRQPRTPKLVSRQGAAKILGVNPPHLSRLDGRLPAPIKVEGTTWPVYVKADIQALAKELKAERKARQKAKT